MPEADYESLRHMIIGDWIVKQEQAGRKELPLSEVAIVKEAVTLAVEWFKSPVVRAAIGEAPTRMET